MNDFLNKRIPALCQCRRREEQEDMFIMLTVTVWAYASMKVVWLRSKFSWVKTILVAYFQAFPDT